MWYTVGWPLRWSCFLRRLSSEWFSATVSPACFQESGTVTLAKILQTLWFPGSAVFHRRMEDFRPRVAVFTALYCYTYAKPLCVSVHPTSRGQCNCGACRHSLIIPLHPTLYHAYEACTHCLCIAATIPTTRLGGRSVILHLYQHGYRRLRT